MTDMRMEKNTVKEIKKKLGIRKREKESVSVCERERAGKRWPWFLSRKEKPNTFWSCSIFIVFSSALPITRK